VAGHRSLHSFAHQGNLVAMPPALAQPASPANLTQLADFYRIDASRKLDAERRSELGQFFTPHATAQLMASMATVVRPSMRLLDAGAGVGSLTAAWVAEMCSRAERPREIAVTAYELDSTLVPYLESTLESCRFASEAVGIALSWRVHQVDFIRAASAQVRDDLFASECPAFDAAILNPPYKKIRSDSEARIQLREAGIETSNLYTAFLALVVHLLDRGGELIAITPRSFCNGPYFRPFRTALLDSLNLRRLHVFESRQHAFREDDVLQENVILAGVKGEPQAPTVHIAASLGPDDPDPVEREVPFGQVVKHDDPERFIHVVPGEWGDEIAADLGALTHSLDSLGLEVSTGRVVDFRATEWLRAEPGADTVPLIYPGHFVHGFVAWPKAKSRKPNAIAVTPNSQTLLVPSGVYVLVKRFSAKEERRRVVAAVYDPSRIEAQFIGFENHLNYFHQSGQPLPRLLALGLAAFLNSTVLDTFFRHFNGHTQVNATDLRNLKYPSRGELERLGARIGDELPPQDALDKLMEEELPTVTKGSAKATKASRRIEEAQAILKDFGLPDAQQNERSALTLLALLDVRPETPWAEAREPLIGIATIMDWMSEHYGKKYKTGSRESVRKFTMHQFVDAGLALKNTDDMARAINSGKTGYRIEPAALAVLRLRGTEAYEPALRDYIAGAGTLAKRYAQEREMERIPLRLTGGKPIALSPGGQNKLVEKIIHEFCPRFTPDAIPLYVGDTDEKWALFEEERLASLDVRIDEHGKMPDVVVYYTDKNWLVLIEAVTSHGPVDAKRLAELKTLFAGATKTTAGIVLVTAFLTREALKKYLPQIAWETEVWVAEAPTHMIHFNGERFLGPY
jgi:adenine-specific DNA-methyltransferase